MTDRVRRLRLSATIAAAALLSGCKLLDYIRDWNWDLRDLWTYVWDTAGFHVDRLGWSGYILVPLFIWVILLVMRPTRYLTSLFTLDLYRHTLSKVVSAAWDSMVGVLVWVWGQVIARFRGALGWVRNQLK